MILKWLAKIEIVPPSQTPHLCRQFIGLALRHGPRECTSLATRRRCGDDKAAVDWLILGILWKISHGKWKSLCLISFSFLCV